MPVVNSRDVAEKFEKRHADVLRDIENLPMPEANADLRSLWFRFAAKKEVSVADLLSSTARNVAPAVSSGVLNF